MPNPYGGRENLEAIEFLRAAQRDRRATSAPARSRSPRSPRPGAASRAGRARAASASPSSGTWAGCTTRSTTSRATRSTARSPRRAHVRDALRVQRALHQPLSPRRGRARQGLAAREDAGRRVAEARQPARCCSPTSTRGPASSCSSWAPSSRRSTSGTTTAASTGTCSTIRRTGTATLRRRAGRALSRASPALWRRDPEAAGFEWIDCTDRHNSVWPTCAGTGRERARPPGRGAQLHAGAARSAIASACRGSRRTTCVFDSDAGRYGGSDRAAAERVVAEDVPWHGFAALGRARAAAAGGAGAAARGLRKDSISCRIGNGALAPDTLSPIHVPTRT